MRKKILVMGMSLAMIAVLAACGNTEASKNKEKENVKVEETVATDSTIGGGITDAAQQVKEAIDQETNEGNGGLEEATQQVENALNEQQDDQETTTTENEGQEDDEYMQGTGGLQIANPYVELDSAEEMMDSANLEVTLPTSVPDWVTETIYRAMPKKLIEVIYKDDVNEIRVRAANGSDDISGVYGSDGEVKMVDVNGQEVEFTMIDGKVTMAKWTNDMPRTYSVTSTEGIPEDVMTQICSEIQ